VSPFHGLTSHETVKGFHTDFLVRRAINRHIAIARNQTFTVKAATHGELVGNHNQLETIVRN